MGELHLGAADVVTRRASGGVRVRGSVSVVLVGPDGTPRAPRRYPNTATQYGLLAYASWITGVYNTPNVGGATNLPGPAFVALGNGTGTPGTGDLTGFAEVDGTRAPLAYTQVFSGDTAMLVANYPSPGPPGTFTEAMLFDQPAGSAVVGAAGASAGATTLPLAGGVPAVIGGSAPGQYTTAYIADGANSEYVALGAPAGAGASSWSLRAPLQYAHAAGVAIVVFTGNLFAHSAITIDNTSQNGIAVQWSIPVSAS